MKEIFDIEQFNIIRDAENYYFFRALEPGDIEDLEKGIIGDKSSYTRLRTDRERWEEIHREPARWNKEGQVTLEEMYSHIKMHYSLQTNCISLSSNANVARTYGDVFSDNYVMIKVPKKEMGQKVFHAGQYMLEEIEKQIEQRIAQGDISEDILADLQQIENAQTSQEIQDAIKVKYKSAEPINTSKSGLKKGITYRAPQARVSSYQALNEEQTLEKNKIIAKLTVLEKKGIMPHLMPRTANNNLLIQTVGSAFSSSEQIYYGDIEGERVTAISKEVLDIFGLLQQVEGQDKQIVEELEGKLIEFITQGNELTIPENSVLRRNDTVKDSITIEEMYELTNGSVEYGKASSIVKNMFYLAKGQLNARALAEILREITGNDAKYEKVIEYIENNGFEIEPSIVNRKSNQGYKLSEAVNLNLKRDAIGLIDQIKSLTDEEQIEILEQGGLSNVRDILSINFEQSKIQAQMTKQEYYAGAIIDTYDWKKIGIEEFGIEQRSELLQKLMEKDCVSIYEKLKEARIEERDITGAILNVVSKDRFGAINE